MRKRTRITALTMAATLLASGTAFAYDQWPAEYSISPGKGEIIVSNEISSPAVPYSGTDHVEVTEVAGKNTVIIKDTINETEINDGRRATIAVNADVNVKVGDIYNDVSESGNLLAIVVEEDAAADVTSGDITVIGNGVSAIAYFGEGTAEIGDALAICTGDDAAYTVVTQQTGDSQVTLNADSVIAAIAIDENGEEEEEERPEALQCSVLGSAMAVGMYAMLADSAKFNANVKGDIHGDTAAVYANFGEVNDALLNINSLGTISGGMGAIGLVGNDGSALNVNTWKLENSTGYRDRNNEEILIATNIRNLGNITNDDEACKKVNYIVKTNSGNSTITLTAADGSELSTTGDAFDEEYKTQNEGKDIVVKVQAADGYEVTGLNAGTATDGSQITAVKNADGTWTITVPRGGGIDITPILEAIAKQENRESTTILPSSLSTNWDGTKTYYKANGEAAKNEWQLITVDGVQAWYHFNENCKMNTGWMTDASDGYTYYFDPATGKMATGIVVIDGKQYHFNETVTGSSGWKQNAAGQWVYEKQNTIPLGALIG